MADPLDTEARPDLVTVDRPDEHVAIVTIQRPEKKSALSIAVRDEIAVHLDDLALDEDVRAVVITGVGNVFCSGFDLREFEQAMTDEEFGHQLWASSDRYHHRVITMPIPTITEEMEGPMKATNTISRTRFGMVWKNSAMRITRSSIIPPK